MTTEPDGAMLLVQALMNRLEARGIIDPADRSAIVDQAAATARQSGPAGWAVARYLKQAFGRTDAREVSGRSDNPKR